MSKYQSYAEYKDSNSEWVGKVPQHWRVTKLKYYAYQIVDGAHFTPTYVDEGVPFLRVTDVQTKVINKKNIKYIPKYEHDELVKRCKPAQGDLLLSKNGTIGVPKVVDWAWEFSIFVSLCLIKLKPSLDVRFLSFFFMSHEIREQIFGQIKQSTVINLHLDKIENFELALPLIVEQQKIASFLDHETAKIDTLIEKQQQLIKLLKEKRQAVISHAVTKGLNPDAPMRDSGVEWLGEVPEHWVVNDLNYNLNAIGDVDHYMPKSVEKGIPYLMTGDLKEQVSKINLESCKQVSDTDYLNLSKKIKNAQGDVIMARYATIGTASYIDIDADFLVSYSCVTIKTNPFKLIGLYLFYYCKSDSFLQGVRNQINTNTQENVGVNDLKKVKIVLPTLDEQSKIIEYLKSELYKLDVINAKSQAGIQLLQERRTALISAAVTGKIDVRNWQSPEKISAA